MDETKITFIKNPFYSDLIRESTLELTHLNKIGTSTVKLVPRKYKYYVNEELTTASQSVALNHSTI